MSKTTCPSPKNESRPPKPAASDEVEKRVKGIISRLPSGLQGQDAFELLELPGCSLPSQHSYLINVRGDAQSKVLVSLAPMLGRLLLERTVAVRECKLRAMVEFMAGQLVTPTAEDTQMAQRLADRQTRVLGEFGFFTAEQLAKLNRSRATNQSALANNWKKRRQVFSVPHRTGASQVLEVFPGFQFEDGRPIKAVQAILAAFGDRKTPWKLALWFTSNNGWLPGQVRPVDLLESDPEAVLRAAKHEAAGSSA